MILLQTASAFSYSDLNVGSSGLKMSSSNSGRYQNVTVKNKGVLNLNGWGLEVYGDMKVEKGSKVKNGVIIFRSKKGSLEGLPLYENVQERYGEIGGGLAAIWKNWEISDLPPMLVYDEAVPDIASRLLPKAEACTVQIVIPFHPRIRQTMKCTRRSLFLQGQFNVLIMQTTTPIPRQR